MTLCINILNFTIELNIHKKTKSEIIKWNLHNISDCEPTNKYVNVFSDDDGYTDVRHIFHCSNRRWAFFEYLKLHPEINKIKIIDYLFNNRNTLFEETPYKYVNYDNELLIGMLSIGALDAVNYLLVHKKIPFRKYNNVEVQKTYNRYGIIKKQGI